tara:strand:+ start:34423 stop:34773 length:351 start_codon:yes stop_codon:yes gene_type:complete
MGLVRYQDLTYVTVPAPTEDLNTGRQTFGEESDPVTIRGNMQPIVGEDKNLIPEGRRYTDFKSIWTDPEYPLTWDMVFIVNEDRYEVFHIDDWDSGSATIPHYKAIVQRQGSGGTC